MRRLSTTAAVAMAMLAVGWAWYRNQPDPEWLCGSDAALTCVADTTLDTEAVLPGGRAPEIDVSNATASVVAAVRSDDDQALVLFDLETGDATRTILSPAQGWIQTPRFSPDGTLVVAVHDGRDANPDGSVLEVFDTATGESVATHPFGGSGWHCSGRLGISPDNAELQCGNVVRDLGTGEVLESLEEENRWAGSGYGSWAWAASGRTVERNVLEDRYELIELVDGKDVEVGPLDLPDLPFPVGTDSAFTDSGDPPDLVFLGSREAGGAWDRWRRTERAFPLGSLVILEDADVTATGLLGFTPDEVGWTADDSAVWILDRGTGRVMVVEPPT